MKNYKLSSLLFTVCLSVSFMHAEINLPPIFTDNMVLQQQTEAPIWGKATANKTVTIVSSWDNKTYSTKADELGNWKINLNTPIAGGPYSIIISDGKKLQLSNVLIGEVWICSGQSNMEMPLAGWGEVNNYKAEIAAANYNQIRLLHVEKTLSTEPLNELKVVKNGWQVCSSATISEFSSTAYFFGRNIHLNTNVPIGLINTSWGGTVAEAWTNAETLQYMPAFKTALEEVHMYAEPEVQKRQEQARKGWNDTILANDNGFKNQMPIWVSTNFNDNTWAEMTLPQLWEKNYLTNFDGIVWFRKTIEIPSHWAGKELWISLAMIDDNDITYFNGQKIGETNGYNKKRLYKVPAKLVKKGQATITVRVTDTSGGGGFHGSANNMYMALANKVEDTISLAGNWKYNPTVNLSNYPKAPQSNLNNPNRPSVLYNAMIHPLIPFAFKGVIWYQGESNAERAEQYKDLFPLMIQDWRKQWSNNFPFYFVQLANFREQLPEPAPSSWAALREAQLQTLHLSNTGMAVTIDIGDAQDIHPKNKQEVGLRLAYIARAQTYGEQIAYSGPIYKTHKIERNKIILSFDYAELGLKTKDANEKLKGFSIAGPDHVFYWAEAQIQGSQVVVSSPHVTYPMAVRYAWADNPDCNLYNMENLPASPFRTDNW